MNREWCFRIKVLLLLQKMPSNHYCLVEIRNSNIVVEGNKNKHIFGRNAYILSKSTWGNTEDFTNVYVNHKAK